MLVPEELFCLWHQSKKMQNGGKYENEECNKNFFFDIP